MTDNKEGPVPGPSKSLPSKRTSAVAFGSPEFRAKVGPPVSVLDKSFPDPWEWLSFFYYYLGAAKHVPANPRNRALYYKCRACDVKVTAYVSSTNGLKKHQQSHHRVTNEQWKAKKDKHKSQMAAEPTASQQELTQQSCSSSQRSFSSPPPFAGPLNRYVHTAEKVNQLVMKLIINQCLPFRIVESPEFLELFREITPQVELLSRRQVSDRVQTMFADERDRLKLALSTIKWVATTADVWTGPNTRYVQMELSS